MKSKVDIKWVVTESKKFMLLKDYIIDANYSFEKRMRYDSAEILKEISQSMILTEDEAQAESTSDEMIVED